MNISPMDPSWVKKCCGSVETGSGNGQPLDFLDLLGLTYFILLMEKNETPAPPAMYETLKPCLFVGYTTNLN